MFLTPAFGQGYTYVNYTTQNGLAGTTVYAMAQDKDGFMWFATETGLSRFDGVHFRKYTIKDGLPADEVLNLFVDSHNRIWIIPFKNAICYYQNGRIHNRQNDSVLSKLRFTNEAEEVLEDKNGNILIQTVGVSNIITPDKKVYTFDRINNARIHAVYATVNNKGGFEVISFSMLQELDIHTIDTGGFSYVRTIAEKTPYRMGLFSKNWEIFKDNNYFGVHSAVHKTSYTLKIPPDFLSFSELNDSLIFLNTRRGTYIYNYEHNKPAQYFLQQYSISSVLVDKEGSYWFSTLSDGVFKIANLALQNLMGGEYVSPDKPVYCLSSNNHKIYIGSDNGLVYITNSEKNKITDSFAVKYSKGRITTIDSIENTDRLILGTDMALLSVNNKGESEQLIQNSAIKSMQYIDKKWLVSSNFAVFEIGNRLMSGRSIRTSDNVLTDRSIINDSMLIRSGRSTVALKYMDAYYIGTLDGLYNAPATKTYFDTGYVRGKHAFFMGDSFPVFNNRIADIKSSSDGTVWVATYGAGTVGYKNGKIIYRIDMTQGLSSDVCRTLFCDGANVWVGTDNGINKISFASTGIHIDKYSTNDGLPSNIINAIYTKDGKVYAGTSRGLAFFDETKMAETSMCNLKLLTITAGNKTFIDSFPKIFLRKHDNISFEFAGISLKSAGDITYQHRLVGLDTGWISGQQNILDYLSLPAGSFTLQIIATNKFGIKSKMLSIPFVVEKPFFETYWVQIPALLLLLAGTWFLIARRYKKAKKINEEKAMINKRAMEMEQMALRAQMNPHFIFNSLNSIQQYVIDKDVGGANKYITSFSRLIRQTLDNSAREKISIADEVLYLTTYLELEKMRMENLFTYSIKVDALIDSNQIFIPPMLLQPFIENSIRHGVRYRNDRDGQINIDFSIKKPHLICTITDNGVGRKLSQQYKGNKIIEYQSRGMSLTAERINLINVSGREKINIQVEDLESRSNQFTGTRVTIKFPAEGI